LRGACQGGQCQPFTVAGGGFVEIAIDATNAYWTTSSVVNQVALAGGTTTLLASGLGEGAGIAVDATSVYWADNAGTLDKAPIGGGSITMLVTTGDPAQVAVDGTDVYYSETGNHKISKVPIAGGSVVTLVSTITGAAPGDMTIDANNVYWCTTTTPVEVRMVPKSGGSFVTLAPSQVQASGVAVDATSVYWAAPFAGEIRKVPITGGTYTSLFTGQTSPNRLALDGATLYWTSGSGVWRGPVSGGTATKVIGGATYDIKVDASAIYFTTAAGALLGLAK
jgi:sugar lactone lactonase YvrE